MATKLTHEELEENRKMSMKVLENSYLMYENSKKDLKENGMKKLDRNGEPIHTQKTIDKNLELMETMEKDIIEKYIQLGGTEEELKALKKKKQSNSRKVLEEVMKKEAAKEEWAEYISKMKGETENREEDNVQKEEIKPMSDEGFVKTEVVKQSINDKVERKPIKTVEETVNKKKVEIIDDEPSPISNKANFNVPDNQRKLFDVIKLPSKGLCYKCKKDNIKVSYLTAYDENMILSPNLYKEGTFLDYLLKEKVIDDEISAEELVEGDRDAIIVWLRATGYGNDYPIVVRDDETGKEFDAKADLSKLNYKPFNLKSDSNGYFSFEMPVSKDIVKFKYLSMKEENILKQQKDAESKSINNQQIKTESDKLMKLLLNNDIVSDVNKTKLKNIVDVIKDEIDKKYDKDADLTFTHELTDRLLLQTVSVNGISDRKYINDYVLNMNVKDAAAYRRYMGSNQPGVDFTIEVERPKSLGGGSLKSFLRFDQFVFINM